MALLFIIGKPNVTYLPHPGSLGGRYVTLKFRRTIIKTRELIRQLQEADPSGELECCVGNADIHYVDRLPAYYDGSLEVLERDLDCSYYNIVGARVVRSGEKVQIHYLYISEALYDNPDLPVVIEGTDHEGRRSKWLEERRAEARRIESDSKRSVFSSDIPHRLHALNEERKKKDLCPVSDGALRVCKHLAAKIYDWWPDAYVEDRSNGDAFTQKIDLRVNEEGSAVTMILHSPKGKRHLYITPWMDFDQSVEVKRLEDFPHPNPDYQGFGAYEEESRFTHVDEFYLRADLEWLALIDKEKEDV